MILIAMIAAVAVGLAVALAIAVREPAAGTDRRFRLSTHDSAARE
jgi:hypothetical protein